MRAGHRSLVIRADASERIGLGHVMRCLALAAAWRSQGGEVCFATRNLAGNASDRITRHGFPVRQLPPPDAVDDVLPEEDARALAAIAGDSRAAGVLVDHYGATTSYLGRLRRAGLAVAVIDDRADRDLAAADWVLNQNIGAPGLGYATGPGRVRLLGVEYALLRPEFRLARERQHRRFGREDHRLLVTLGGGDTAALASRTLAALEDVGRLLEIRCVAAGSPPAMGELERQASRSRHRVGVVVAADSLAEHMAWADLSVNGAGVTCWELMCLGAPMLVMALSDDQRDNARLLDETACARFVDPGDRAGLAAQVGELLQKPELREQWSARGMALVDGRGAERAAASLMQLLDDRSLVRDATN